MSTKRLKLLVVSMLYEPDCVGIAAIATDLCVALAERGHDMTVYTTYPYYPEWSRKCDANPWRVQEESLNKVKVKRYGLFVPSNPSRLVPRLVHEISFPLSLMRSLFHRQKYDGVMVFCPLLGSVAFAAMRKLFYREPLWVNIQDIPAEASKATGIAKSRLFHYFGSRAQRGLFRQGEVWSSISPEMVAQVEPLKSKQTQLHLVPNWLTGSLTDNIQRLPAKVVRTSSDPCHLLYCGNIGKKQGLKECCERLQRCAGEFEFHIHGEGSEAKSVQEWVQTCGDRRFHYGGLMPETEFVQRIHAADWFVICEKPDAGFSFLPSKLIPCMSIGTPVAAISSRGSPLGQEVRQNSLGLAAQWSQIEELPGQMIKICQTPERYAKFRENCRQRAAAFSRETAIDRIEVLLHKFVGNEVVEPHRDTAPIVVEQ
ncbi:MAG: glycosyltransferase family 4 protein [Planctomycetales bacterium]|nr:glycosyltransferase family 4 protein [Planctomycetales bacterium]